MIHETNARHLDKTGSENVMEIVRSWQNKPRGC